ncbi:hypothetical protein SAMN05216553_101801 [Lentzea fradiae]|uniref:Uncharacterized protein n=1 Tax=Lentzea fradiae TaxID=200378 RepID=A0A1G7LDI2_9PSEU|nr:hypothetical protein [Lentzea fradiae]SDF47451.1 hypothetical protein SAMN05216553_101801 [Lentzea fradiae]
MDVRSDGGTGDRGGAVPPERFAGDLFLQLARRGWLVLEPARAQGVIDELERTLDEVRSRLRKLELSRKLRDAAGDQVAPDVDRIVVDAVFAGQLNADSWERALVELPKYIEAMRIAGRNAGEPR